MTASIVDEPKTALLQLAEFVAVTTLSGVVGYAAYLYFRDGLIKHTVDAGVVIGVASTIAFIGTFYLITEIVDEYRRRNTGGSR